MLLFSSRRRLFDLLSVPHYRVQVAAGQAVPMRDGIHLATDHYQPQTAEPCPTILIRSPYGRRASAGFFGLLLAMMAQRFAERGYQVVVQDVRGRFDSGGEFNPYFNEARDGEDTLAWIKSQPWYNGKIGMWGPSYLGLVQWAVGSHLDALVPSVTGSRLEMILYPDGAFDLGLALRWLTVFQALDKYANRPVLAAAPLPLEVELAIRPAFAHLPITEADTVALKQVAPYYRMWLEHPDPDDAVWQDARQTLDISRLKAPVHLVGGWYDFFLRTLLLDYQTLREGGQNPYLTIGPWHHFSNFMHLSGSLGVALDWFDAHLKDNSQRLREKSVRIYVMGANQWREMDDWPPPATETPYYLHQHHQLTTTPPQDLETPDHFRYDPQQPTPAFGGAQFSLSAGPKDNRRHERRPDVLTYTTLPLTYDVEVIGPVRLRLYAHSSRPYTDFFGRLCDVHPDGRSVNICDGLFRINPQHTMVVEGGIWCLEVDMWATAHCFKTGHSIRLQVSSGAHPRWCRNLGSDSPTTLYCAEQTIYHDADHPSALILPIH